MNRLIAVLLVFLLSLSSTGCVHADAPSTIVPDEGFLSMTVWKVDGTIEHYYKINGQFQNVGCYEEITDDFLEDYTYNGRSVDELYETHELTGERLTHRKGVLICEICIGIVTNAQTGEGRVLNTDGYYNFISYKGFDQPYEDGTVIVTYLVYNPENNYEDDIVDRYDFVLTREYED